MRYAIRRHVSFESFLCARNKWMMLKAHQDLMMEQISKAVGFEVGRQFVDTFVRPYPRDVGEQGMAYNPLIPRVGNEPCQLKTRTESN